MAAMQPPQFPALFCLIPPLICLMVPLAFVMLIINVYGFRSCLLAETGAVASIGRGWQLFRRALGNTILTGVFAFIANAVVGLLILVPMIPFGLNFANEFFSTGFSAAMFWRLLPLMLYMAIASVALGGIVRAYFATLWTKVYEVLRSADNHELQSNLCRPSAHFPAALPSSPGPPDRDAAALRKGCCRGYN
ncbi:MAG: hypothetical protein R2867_20075 [Caldilineaceae bacterium]